MRLSGINIYALIFLALYSLSVTRIYMPALNYLFCKDYIAENLCVNKDFPANNCEGKCYLTSETGKIAKEESGKSQNSLQTKAEEVPAETIFFQPLFISGSIQSEFKDYSNLYTYQFLSNILHPPGC